MARKADIFRRLRRDAAAADFESRAEEELSAKQPYPLVSLIEWLAPFAAPFLDWTLVRQHFQLKIALANHEEAKNTDRIEQFFHLAEQFRSPSNLGVKMSAAAVNLSMWHQLEHVDKTEQANRRRRRMDFFAKKVIDLFPAYPLAKSVKPHLRLQDGILTNDDRKSILKYLSDQSISYSQELRVDALQFVALAFEQTIPREAVLALKECERIYHALGPGKRRELQICRLKKLSIPIRRHTQFNEAETDTAFKKMQELRQELLKIGDYAGVARAASYEAAYHMSRSDFSMATQAYNEAIRNETDESSYNYVKFRLDSIYALLQMSERDVLALSASEPHRLARRIDKQEFEVAKARFDEMKRLVQREHARALNFQVDVDYLESLIQDGSTQFETPPSPKQGV
eukprot:TRINITY_DN2569_c0_g1_i1.p1 TRINITY_DN2569_c0_g1~~TRINITY_DN2569_c0_g1_i1.p1  ORF type:complete len:400 (-),score=54.36 TRINITY_DN2569_c0_g1_i1:159-1358(-)